MRLLGAAMAVLAVAMLGAGLGLASWSQMPLSELFPYSNILAKLVDFLLLASLVMVVVVGLIPLKPDSAAATSSFLTWVVCGAPLLGFLVAAQGWLTVWKVASDTHTTNFMVVAPSVATNFFPLGLGLLVGALAAFLGGRKAPAVPQASVPY